MCKIIFPAAFYNVKILIFQVVKGLKGQKIPQNDEKFCLLHLIFHEPSIIWSSFMVHMYVQKDNIFRHFQYFDFRNHWGAGVVKGWNMVQNDKKLCLPHSLSQEPYITWLWFLVHMCKMMISPANFFIIQNFDFFWFLGG